MKPRKKKKRLISLVLVAILLITLLNTKNIARFFYPVKYENEITRSAQEYGIDPYLIMSIIKAESNFDETAVSHKNASGLMQIIEPTARWIAMRMDFEEFTYDNITDPELNIRMGCYYIAYLLDHYDGNVKNAVAAYNAGHGNVDRWLSEEGYPKDGLDFSQIPFPETRRYVTRVLNNQKIYQMLYDVKSENKG